MIAPSRQVLLDCLFLGTGERDVFGATDSDDGYSTRKAWLATRPSLPPLLFLAGFTWLGDALAIEVLCGSSLEMAHLAFICGFGIAAIAFGILASGGTMGGCVALGIALGCALGASHTCAVMSGQAQLLATKAPLVVCAVQDSRPASYGSTFLARAENGALVRIVDTRGERTLVGDRFNATATWKAPTGVSARESWRKGISAVSVSARLEVFDQDLVFQPLYTLRRKAIQQIKERSEDLAAFTGIECDEAAMMLSAIVLGYAADLYDSELYQTVKVDGLAHLVAVSGAHLAIVCGFLFLAIGGAQRLGLNALIVCMVMGMAIANLSAEADAVLECVEPIAAPVFILFFVASGAGLPVNLLRSVGIIGLVYILARYMGKILGTLLGGALTGTDRRQCLHLGPCLLPQAGIAIGLTLAAGSVLPKHASNIRAIVLTGTLICELVGPAVTRLSLKKAGEISPSP